MSTACSISLASGAYLVTVWLSWLILLACQPRAAASSGKARIPRSASRRRRLFRRAVQLLWIAGHFPTCREVRGR